MAQVKVKVGADGTEFTAGLAEMRKQAREFFGEIKEMGTKMGELFGISLAAEGIKRLVEQFNEIGRQSRKFGETAEDMQKIGTAARMTGVDVDSLFSYMTRLDKAVGETASGIKDHDKFFAMMGQSAKDYMGVGIEKKLELLTEGFETADKKGMAAVAMFDLLGRGAQGMMPLVSIGSEKFKEFMGETTVASSDVVAEMEHINEEIEQFTQTLKVWIVEGISGIDVLLWKAAAGIIGFIKNSEAALAWVGDKVGANTDMMTRDVENWAGAQALAQQNANDALARLHGDGTEKFKEELEKRKKLQGQYLEAEEADAKKAEAEKAARKADAAAEKEHRDSVSKEDYEFERAEADQDEAEGTRILQRQRALLGIDEARTDTEKEKYRLALARIDAEERKDARQTVKKVFEEEKTLVEDQIKKLQEKLKPEHFLDFPVTELRKRGGAGGDGTLEGVGMGGLQTPEVAAINKSIDELQGIKAGIDKVLVKMDGGGKLK